LRQMKVRERALIDETDHRNRARDMELLRLRCSHLTVKRFSGVLTWIF